MALMEQPLLTIAIPTYNREKFLDQCLNCIGLQSQNKNFPIEVIVSDNCSTDRTTEIAEKYRFTDLNIRYIKNIENKGPDFNISQCFLEAKGKYVLIMGDDDFFIEGAIEKIVSILKREINTGIIYLKGLPYNEAFKIIGTVSNKKKYSIYYDKLEFVKRVNYNFTFISGNIVNKDLFFGTVSESFYNSYLLQLSWVFTVLNRSITNIVIEDDVLAIGSTDNTGGYKLYDVFIKNFNNIMNSMDKEFSNSFKRVINRNLLLTFFPGMIIQDRNNSSGIFLKESPSNLFHQYYNGNLVYCFVIYPLLHLPKQLLKYWLYLFHIFNRFRNLILRLDFKKNKYLKKIVVKDI